MVGSGPHTWARRGLRTSPVYLWFSQRRPGRLPSTCSKHGGLSCRGRALAVRPGPTVRVPASSGSGGGGSSGEKREPSPPAHDALLMEGDCGCWVIVSNVCARHACTAWRENRSASHKCQGPRRGGKEAPGVSASGLQRVYVCVRESMRVCIQEIVCISIVCVCKSVCESVRE